MRLRVRFVWSALATMLMMSLFVSTSALAIGNLRLGLVEVHPELTLTGGLDDNVFLEDDDEKDDEFGVVTPGINLILEKDDHYVGLGYTVDIIRYDEYSNQDSENHTAFGVLELNFPGALFIKLEEIYQDTSDYANHEFDKRIDRRQNDGNASIGFLFSDRFSLQLDYISEHHRYDPDAYERLNRLAQEFGPAVYIKFLPKTSAIVEYHYGMVDYFDVEVGLNDNSSTFHQVMGGLQWEITGKSTGTLKGGYQWREYEEEDSLVGSKIVDRKDKNTWVVSGEVEVEFTPKTSAHLLLKRAIVESSFTDTFNDYYLENMASLGLSQKVLEKLTFSVDLAYYLDRYHRRTRDRDEQTGEEVGKKEKREDKIFDGRAGLEYKIQEWLMVGANYRYQNRDSNFTHREYTDSQGTAYVKVVF